MRVIEPDRYRVMPWKNGGGSTTEIAIFPEGSSLDDFDWRISMATVAEAGPFSAFPGIDRTLSIIQGAGMRLEIGGAAIDLDHRSPPYGFPADVATRGTPLAGSITDLNVMTRRGRWRHTVAHLSGPGPLKAECHGETSLLLALSPCAAEVDQRQVSLPALSSLILAGTASRRLTLTATDPIDAYLVDLFDLTRG
jgi:environmental stress-induced protein Ves